MIRHGIPAAVLAQRLDHLLTSAKLEAEAGETDRLHKIIIEAQDVLQQLKGAI